MASKTKRLFARNLVWGLGTLSAFVLGAQFGLTSRMRATIRHTHSTISDEIRPEIKQMLGWLGKETHSRHALKGRYTLAQDQSYGFFDDIDDFNWKMMQERAMRRHNHRFIDPLKFRSEPSRWYMNNYEPDFTCPQERRVGGPGDGPKWVCDPHRLISVVERRTREQAKNPSCLIYSVGSAGKFQFEDGMFNITGMLCEVHIFDPWNCSRPELELSNQNMFFHHWGLVSSYDLTYKPVVKNAVWFTLEESLKRLGHEGRTIDVFKIDCEFCEWQCFKDWFKHDIRQLLVETHEAPENVLDFFDGMQKENFYLFHKEPNIHPRAAGRGIEWSYIRLHPNFAAERELP